MAVIGINYEEPDVSTYKSVDIYFGGGVENIIFDSGDFVKDWYAMNKHIIMNDEKYEHEHFVCSSSVDHFSTDDKENKYESRYLKFDNSKPYLDTEYDENNHEFFIDGGTNPTWSELKAMCE